MSIREARRQIMALDQRATLLESHVAMLTRAKERYLLDGSVDALETVRLIEQGVPRLGGRPSDPELAGFDIGLRGLEASHYEIDQLRERRALLVRQLPSQEETADAQQAAATHAEAIRTRAAELEAYTTRLRTALADVTRLALGVADDGWALFVASTTLDTLCAEADIARPETPRPRAPKLAIAVPLATLMRYFMGDGPVAVDSDLRQDLDRALAEVTTS